MTKGWKPGSIGGCCRTSALPVWGTKILMLKFGSGRLHPWVSRWRGVGVLLAAIIFVDDWMASRPTHCVCKDGCPDTGETSSSLQPLSLLMIGWLLTVVCVRP